MRVRRGPRSRHGQAQQARSQRQRRLDRGRARQARRAIVFVRVGENIADGQKTVDQVMDTWMKSPGHRGISWPTSPRWERPESKTTKAKITGASTSVFRCPGSIPTWPPPRWSKRSTATGKPATRCCSNPNRSRPSRHGAERRHGRQRQPRDRGDPFKHIDEKALEGRDIRLQLSANVPTPNRRPRSSRAKRPINWTASGKSGSVTPRRRTVLPTGRNFRKTGRGPAAGETQVTRQSIKIDTRHGRRSRAQIIPSDVRKVLGEHFRTSRLSPRSRATSSLGGGMRAVPSPSSWFSHFT